MKLGTADRVERYDPIAIAALYAPSFRDALQRMARYKQITCPEAIHIVERANECRVQFEWLLAEEDEPPLLIDVRAPRQHEEKVTQPVQIDHELPPRWRIVQRADAG